MNERTNIFASYVRVLLLDPLGSRLMEPHDNNQVLNNNLRFA